LKVLTQTWSSPRDHDEGCHGAAKQLRIKSAPSAIMAAAAWRPSSRCSANPAGIGAQPATLNGSLFSSKRDRKIAASIGSLKQYRTYAAHSSSTYMSNLPAYDSRKFMISLSSVSCRRGSTTWYGHSASSFCSQALRLSGSMVISYLSATQR